MKICILSNSHSTTDVRLYYKMARSLAKLGEVYLICGCGVRNAAQNPFQQVVGTESRWLALFALYRKAARIKPEIVICVEPLTLFSGFALRRRLGTKVIFDVHEFFPDAFAERFHPPFSWLFKSLYLSGERWLQNKADATISVCTEILDQLVPHRKRDQAVVIPNYPVRNVWDYNCETPAEISTICGMDFDLIYIGGLTADRGLFKLLHSVNILKQEFPRLTVLILGKFFSAEIEKKFNDLVNDWNLNAIIYQQNWLPAEKIGLLLKRSRIGLWVFNPRNWRMSQAVPLKVLEYCAAGLPVLSINTPLMRDLVEGNGIGLCCEYHSTAIAKTAGEILRLPADEYRAISRRAMKLIDERYNWEAVEPSLLQVVRDLLPE